jgi:hypothetical protein
MVSPQATAFLPATFSTALVPPVIPRGTGRRFAAGPVFGRGPDVFSPRMGQLAQKVIDDTITTLPPSHRRARRKNAAAAVAFMAAMLGSTFAWGLEKVEPLLTGVTYTAQPGDEQRRDMLERIVREKYIDQGDGKIDWYDFAEVAELFASNTHSDELVNRLGRHVDPKNTGLAFEYHNIDRRGRLVSESGQIHHYLGGVTGTASFPTHLFNNPVTAHGREVFDAVRRREPFVQGDVNLFAVGRQHRDDFLREGRHSVANNIRSLLAPKEAQSGEVA